MRKILVAILTVMLCISFLPVSALEKSIISFDEDANIDNAGPIYHVDYNGEEATVYYGKNGIDVVTAQQRINLKTNFPVLKLTVLKDINNDGYIDFITYQSATKYADQILVISGKDGAALSSFRLTFTNFDQTEGIIQSNSFIRKMVSLNNYVLIVYDYHILCVDPLTGETVFDYVDQDNIWDIEIVDNKIAYTDQMGCVGYIDITTGELISSEVMAKELQVERWDGVIAAQMNMWDLYYDGKDLYATTEDGKLLVINNDGCEEVVLGTISEELIKSRKMYDTEWDGLNPVYRKTGYADFDFNSHKIIDDTDGYLLISAYFIDPDSKSDYAGDFEPAFVVYNKNEKTVDMMMSYARFTRKASACISEYNGEKVIVVAGDEEGNTKVRVFDFEEKELYNTTISGMSNPASISLSHNSDGYLVEGYHNGCCQLDEKLSNSRYLFDKVETKLLTLKDDSFVSTYNINGEVSKIVCSLFDMETVKWEYNLDIKEPNKGIEKIFVDDFNNDGIDDIICVINTFDSKFEQQKGSFLVILSGSDGKPLAKTKLLNYKYYDYETRKYVYEYAVVNDLSLIKDTNKDGKKEIVVDGSVYSTKDYSLYSSINTYIENYWTAFEVGDINNDGIKDYLFISDKNASIGQSYFKDGMYNFRLTGNKVPIVKDKGMYTYQFGDINNDGIKEVAVYALNSKGFQVYDIYDGKTLTKMFTLCPDGVGDYETYNILNYDINNDGYNEIFGYTSTCWCKVLVNGKDGNILHYFSDSQHDDDFKPDTDYWHPDYDIPLSGSEDEKRFDYSIPMLVDDVNNDGYRDLAYYKVYWNETDWSSISALMIYDSQTFEVVKEIIVSDGSGTMMELSRINNTDRYFALSSMDEFALYDYQQNDIVANYKINAANYTLVNDTTLMISNSENQVYMVNIEKGFEMVETPEEVIKDNFVDLKWKSYSEYSTMQIYDNGSLVYTGVAEEYRLKLLDGKHTITMSCTDAYGRSSKSTFDITVENHKNTAYWIFATAALSIAVAVYYNLHRKGYVRRHGKEVL